MSKALFYQIEAIRNLTIKAVEGISEALLDTVPEGFNNNLRWNLGHIYLVQEKFAFHFSGDTVQLPESFERLFARGTKPADWKEEPPALEVLLEMLAEQPKRIQSLLQGRLDEAVTPTYTTGSGVQLSTIGEFLTFTLYHEGMHLGAIKLLKRFAG
ncbi:DinB family protein [Paenibacillus sp. YIM B09110]|uniref:DinB family protein n=1 Tax=Paenibacillus sp. YIM B09110 TaxID=3126102 RepID=UPI00301CE2A9